MEGTEVGRVSPKPPRYGAACRIGTRCDGKHITSHKLCRG